MRRVKIKEQTSSCCSEKFVRKLRSDLAFALTRWRQSHRIKTAASTIIVTLATHRRWIIRQPVNGPLFFWNEIIVSKLESSWRFIKKCKKSSEFNLNLFLEIFIDFFLN